MENFLAVGNGLLNLQVIREYEFLNYYETVKVTFLDGSECVYSDFTSVDSFKKHYQAFLNS